jgi:glutaredoxin
MPEVLIYTTSTCPHCRSAKDYLRTMGIKFIEKDCHGTVLPRRTCRGKYHGVPAFKINDEFIVGFDKNRILEKIRFDIVKCPECGQKLRLPADKGKLRVTCSECGHKFEVTT